MAAKGKGAASVDQGPLPLVAYLCGEERLLVLDAHQRLQQRVLAEVRAPDFNHNRVSARNTPMAEIVNLCRTLPMMGPWRLVEVMEAETMPADQHPQLLEYVHAPDPSCTLILVGGKPDMRLKLYKELQSAGVLQVFDKIAERQLPGWLMERAKHHNITLTQDAAEDLAAAIGTELMLQDRALEKLRLVVGEGGRVLGDHVSLHVATTRVETSFKIVDALAAGDLGTAMETMLSVVDAGEAPLRLLGALAYAQRQSIRLLDKMESGTPPAQAAREIRLFQNVDNTVRRVKTAGREGLSAGLMAIARADRALKSSPLAEEDVLVQLLLELGGTTRGRTARGGVQTA